MDPNATLRELVAATCGVDTTLDDIIEHGQALSNWLNSGGFMPTVTAIDLRLLAHKMANMAEQLQQERLRPLRGTSRRTKSRIRGRVI